MPSLLLLLTILTAPAVPQTTWPLLASAIPDHTTILSPVECRLRVEPGGVLLVHMEPAPGKFAWFVLDTGATGTTVSTALASRLGLTMTGLANITTVDGTMSAPTVRLASLGMAGRTVASELDVAVHELALVRQVAPEVEGILGQDVLARFDYLVDHDRQTLTLGRFAPPRHGVVLPLTWSAGRPVVMLAGTSGTPGLVLDTGTDVLVLEAAAARAAVGAAPPARRTKGTLRTHTGSRDVEVEHHTGLRLANVALPAVSLVRLPTADWSMAPEVGFLPASLFSRVYVSARTAHAALWPRR